MRRWFSRDIPRHTRFVLPDGSPVPFKKQEHRERVGGACSCLHPCVADEARPQRLTIGEEQQLQLSGVVVTEASSERMRREADAKISPEYDYLPVVRCGSRQSAIRPITGQNPGNCGKRGRRDQKVRIMLAKIQVDLMLHDPVLAAERAVYEQEAEGARRKRTPSAAPAEEADKRRKMIADQQQERLEAEARKQAEAERARLGVKTPSDAEPRVKLLNRDATAPLYIGCGPRCAWDPLLLLSSCIQACSRPHRSD